MTTFIDKDTGAEWRVAKDLINPRRPDILVIKRVKVEPKKEFWSLWWLPDGVDLPALFSERITQDQAQLIKDCCQELMAWLVAPNQKSKFTVGEEYQMDEPDQQSLLLALHKARNAMEGDK